MKLKKRHIFTIAACTIAAVFFTCVLVIGLAAEPGSRPIKSDIVRGHENTLAIDPVEDEVDSLDISWLTGPVTVGISPDDKIHVTERSAKKLDESDKMKVSVGSGVLTVRWDGQWFRKFFNVNLGWFGQKDKELEVLLPAGLSQELITLDVSNTDGDMSVTGCNAETVDVSTVSGELNVSACSGDEMNMNTVSGGVELSNVSAAGSMTVNTVSGGMELSGVTSETLVIDTVSGSCRLAGQAAEFNANTISGDILMSLTSLPEDVDMDSVSGGLTLELPGGSGFTVEHDSVSGSFKCAFPTEDLGGGRKRCGGGEASIRMNTTSGSMDIRRREQ